MLGANTDYIQATIELFGFLITLIIAMIFQIITVNEKKSEKKLFIVMCVSALALLLDALWYICDGNTSTKSVIINHFVNFVIFLCNPVMTMMVNQFLAALVEERGKKPNRVISLINYIVVSLAMLIPTTNIFYKWVYYIDSHNIYHRMTGWYLYTALNCMAIFSCMIMLFVHRKEVAKARRIALYLFLAAPFIGIALQAVFVGVSFIQIGIAIGVLGILVSYLVDWIRNERKDGDPSDDKKRLWLVECVFGIMILFVSAAIISCIISVNKVADKNSEQSSMALTYMVSETVDGALSEPINVARTMAQSDIIRKALSDANLEGSDTENEMLDFMSRIKEEYGYQMVFASSVKTKSYYTYEGLSRYMDVDNDPNDAWYREYMEKGAKYVLNIDEDKDNDMTLAVFVNMGVFDDEGNVIGICGVGTSIESLMDILNMYGDEYSLGISLTDTDGIICVSTDRDKIGEQILTDINPNDKTDRISYAKSKTKSRLTKFMKGLDWYLVIDDNIPDKLNVFEIILPSTVIYILGVILMVSFSFGFGIIEKRRANQLRASRLLSETDRLTGVKNRNSFETFQKNFNDEKLNEKPLVIAMMDINGLKTVNDKYGHIAGDELIIGASRCIQDTIGTIGDLYRIGGDEFVVISYADYATVQKKYEQLNDLVSYWSGDLVRELAVSIGIASSENTSCKSFSELFKLADERMYADKNAYYRRTGKDRRMSW